METVGDWMALVARHTPPEHAASWDNPGLQVGDPDWPVDRVLVTLDVTSAVVLEAGEVPNTLVLAHHPLVFRPLRSLTPDTAAGKIALMAAQAQVAIGAAHTNLDIAADGTGTSDPVARVLDLQDRRPLTTEAEGPDGASLGFGVVGRLPAPMSLRELAAALRRGLPAPDLRYAGRPDDEVEVVAAVGGAGDGLLSAAHDAGVDVYVTGDLRHHVALDATELGLAVVDAGHHATEFPAMAHWIERLRSLAQAEGLGAPLVASSIHTSPWVVESD